MSTPNPEEFKRATEVTYLGTVYGTMAALKRMRPRDRGKIVQVGSALAYRAIPLQAAYCGAKFGDPRVHRLDPHRVAARPEQGPDHDGAAPWGQHDAVQLVPLEAARHPIPVPPIYQPEIPAEAVYWAAHHRRRELWVGYSAVEAILGSKLAPSLLVDRYLARTGFSGQQVEGMPVDGERPGNLFEPVQGEAATHGIFDGQAKTRSPQLWAATHRAASRGGLGGGCRGGSGALRDWANERAAATQSAGESPLRTFCASTRCWPTASAGSSSARAGTTSGCAFPAGIPAASSPR